MHFFFIVVLEIKFDIYIALVLGTMALNRIRAVLGLRADTPDEDTRQKAHKHKLLKRVADVVHNALVCPRRETHLHVFAPNALRGRRDTHHQDESPSALLEIQRGVTFPVTWSLCSSHVSPNEPASWRWTPPAQRNEKRADALESQLYEIVKPKLGENPVSLEEFVSQGLAYRTLTTANISITLEGQAATPATNTQPAQPARAPGDIMAILDLAGNVNYEWSTQSKKVVEACRILATSQVFAETQTDEFRQNLSEYMEVTAYPLTLEQLNMVLDGQIAWDGLDEAIQVAKSLLRNTQHRLAVTSFIAEAKTEVFCYVHVLRGTHAAPH